MSIHSKIQRGIFFLFPKKQNSIGAILSFLLLSLIGFGFVCLVEITHDSLVIAQSLPITSNNSSIRVEDVAVVVYQKLPYLPKENQYFRQETGEIDPEHTLVSRLIRYHQDFKKRSTRYRFDWKLTLADYLGINDAINPDNYPGKLSLKTNPVETDIKAIQSLKRHQRQELVDLLALLYKPQISTPATPSASPNVPATSKSKPVVDLSKPSLSKPGDAQLLMP